MLSPNPKIDQLTSLRFFAALMIVIHHSVGLFGIESVGVNLGQGVSFFFVLSGFILTYVYQRLDSWSEIKQFWRARIARIFPAYLASFLLGFWLVPFSWDTKTVIAFLFMVQSWVPLSTYYFAYNAACWSVSTELFFYLVFPMLLYKHYNNWLNSIIKLVLSGAIVMGVLVISNTLVLPDYGDPGTGSNGLMVTQHGLIYINPTTRIFEFIFGMTIVTAWQNQKRHQRSISIILATSYEIGAVSICAASMYYMNFFVEWSRSSILGPSASQWFMHSGSVFCFGFLIYIMAQGRGIISKILSTQFLVLLGEISFSMYLIHQILLTIYRTNISYFADISNSVAFTTFLTILLLSSYLMWVYIEKPGRKLILGYNKIKSQLVVAN